MKTYDNSTEDWQPLDIRCIRTVWQCPDCGVTTDWKIPDFLDGTPCCGCNGGDMDYVRSEILVEHDPIVSAIPGGDPSLTMKS